MQVLLPSRSFRILVVDDCLDTTESLRILLEVRGHQVDTACDGPTGLEVALRFHPEVVLLDIGLPRVDGYQVARRLRQVPGMEDILLIAMTGFGQDEDHLRARAAGFDHHLLKPFDLALLERLLDAHGTRRLAASSSCTLGKNAS